MTDTRKCTCHPDDNPPIPCARKYALHDCLKERIRQLTEELDNYKEKALCIHTYWNDETRIEAVMHELKLKGMTIKENDNG